MSKFQIQAGDLHFTFLSTGDLYEARHGTIMINQLLGNPVDGSLQNLYLRVQRGEQVKVHPMLGVRSGSTVQYSKNGVRWQGSVAKLEYVVHFRLGDGGLWFWDVELKGSGAAVEVIYGQDLSLANQGAVLNNEAYVCQYIDHSVFHDPVQGYTVCSRQNQPQGTFPYLQQGSLTEAVGFSTDGFQFFGLDYKATDQPKALWAPTLANEIYQYEFAYIALQSKQVTLTDRARFVFYGLFKPDHPGAVEELEYLDLVRQTWQELTVLSGEKWQEVEAVREHWQAAPVLKAEELSLEEIAHLYPTRQHEEWQNSTLLSFFTPEHNHVVLKAKELLVERPHGHILMSGQSDQIKDNPITTTSYMYGVFNAQLAVGNTSFNKLLSNTRNHLNVFKVSGQRIYVEIDGELRLLALPSAFEMGFNYARWYYKTAQDTFVVTNYTVVDAPEVRLSLESTSGNPYLFVVTNQVAMDASEYQNPYHLEQSDDGCSVLFRAGENTLNAQIEPDLTYKMVVDTKVRVREDRDASLVIFELESTASWNLVIFGLLHGESTALNKRDFSLEVRRYTRFLEKTMGGFHLSLPNGSSEVAKLNTLVWWYTHNMLVHFSVPRGLEQYSGAAWGTRDVCQGPTEYFLATQNYETVKQIIQLVYSHQFWEDGSWPQWFMFDRYYRIQAGESHGDVIIWPLKLLGDYLVATGDFQLLDELIPYTSHATKEFTSEAAPLLEHVQRQINYIQTNFLPGTHLSAYGDGDWDDTLQPANAQLRQYMVSSWTVALTYQALHQFASVIEEYQPEWSKALSSLAQGIAQDFTTYCLPTGVIPGFLYLEDLEKPELMLHPDDTKTGIHYRLLPMTRSIISELVDPSQAKRNYALITEHFACPDGVRLMNRPAAYRGGVSTHFQRAERAANFGREVGLQYVHAHIRYIEAMAKLGKAEEAWWGLAVINPVGLREAVPNAELRQSNAYFSSSDGKFSTRYDASEGFEKLRTGEVPVKGGWRIYSSGPGIYVNQLVSSCLGIRLQAEDLVIDPVLPERLNGLRFDFSLYGRKVRFIYKLASGRRTLVVNCNELLVAPVQSAYRPSGFRVKKEDLLPLLQDPDNVIEVYV